MQTRNIIILLALTSLVFNGCYERGTRTVYVKKECPKMQNYYVKHKEFKPLDVTYEVSED